MRCVGVPGQGPRTPPLPALFLLSFHPSCARLLSQGTAARSGPIRRRGYCQPEQQSQGSELNQAPSRELLYKARDVAML